MWAVGGVAWCSDCYRYCRLLTLHNVINKIQLSEARRRQDGATAPLGCEFSNGVCMQRFGRSDTVKQIQLISITFSNSENYFYENIFKVLHLNVRPTGGCRVSGRSCCCDCDPGVSSQRSVTMPAAAPRHPPAPLWSIPPSSSSPSSCLSLQLP